MKSGTLNPYDLPHQKSIRNRILDFLTGLWYNFYMRNGKLPNFIQPFLWSVKISDLDLEKDKIYIIHQVLAFGNIEAINWLFQTYSSREIKKEFLNHPYRIYRDSAFNFTTKILLGINKTLKVKKYVTNSL